MYLIDTNIILEFLLGQKNADECINLIESLVRKEVPVFISRFGLYSIEIIMISNKNQSSLIKFLDFLMAYSNIKIVSTDSNDDKEIVELAEKYKLDFDDALHFYICTVFNLKIISYDMHFDNTSIKRLKPNDVNL